VPQVLKLASPSIDLFDISRRVASGSRWSSRNWCRRPTWPTSLRSNRPSGRVGWRVSTDSTGWRRIRCGRRLAQPTTGAEVDWRKGSHEYVFSVLGTVPRHEDVRSLEHWIAQEVTVTYD